MRSFYPATLQLSTSKLAIAALGNLAFAMALVAYRITIKVPGRVVNGLCRGVPRGYA